MLKKIWAWLRRLKYIIGIVVVLALIIGGLIVCRATCREAPTVIKEGWKAVQSKKTSGPPATWLPWHKPTKADKILEDWPAGTRIIEVEPHDEPVLIAVPPDGPIQVPDQVTGVTVYEKPKRSWGLEFRPWVGAGYVDGLAAAGGVDLFTVKIVKPIHAGPATAYNGEVAAGGSVGVTMWRNIDARGCVMANLDGEVIYGGALAIGIE